MTSRDGVKVGDEPLALAIQQSLWLEDATAQRQCTICDDDLPGRPSGSRSMCISCEQFLAPTASSPQSEESEPTEQETVEESVWDNIEKWLTTRRGPKPVVNCSICGTELIVPGLQEDDGEREKLQRLPCDHILGMDCVERWIDTRLQDPNNEGSLPTCPFCRGPVFEDAVEEGENEEGEESHRVVVGVPHMGFHYPVVNDTQHRHHHDPHPHYHYHPLIHHHHHHQPQALPPASYQVSPRIAYQVTGHVHYVVAGPVQYVQYQIPATAQYHVPAPVQPHAASQIPGDGYHYVTYDYGGRGSHDGYGP